MKMIRGRGWLRKKADGKKKVRWKDWEWKRILMEGRTHKTNMIHDASFYIFYLLCCFFTKNDSLFVS